MVPSARGHPLPLPHMRRRLDFPARWVRARFEPLPESQGARVGRGVTCLVVWGGGGPSGRRPPAALAAPWRSVARGGT